VLAAEGASRTHLLLLIHVKPVRQNEILSAMKGCKDYSEAFARSLIPNATTLACDAEGAGCQCS
jgi:hypothetical protein